MVRGNVAYLLGSKPFVNIPSRLDPHSRSAKYLRSCLRVHSQGKTRQLPTSLLKHFLGHYAKARKTFVLIVELLRTVLSRKPFHQGTVWNLGDEPWNTLRKKNFFIGECHLVENREDFSHQKSCFKVVRSFSHQETLNQHVTAKYCHKGVARPGWTCPRWTPKWPSSSPCYLHITLISWQPRVVLYF